MAAPSGIVWGSQVDGTGTGGGRIGIYTNATNTNTQTTLTVEIWFWGKWTVDDAINTLRFDNLSSSGSAKTSKGAVRVITTEPNYSWSTTNQVKIATYTYTYTRGTSAAKRYLYASLADIDVVPGTMYASTTFSVPKLASYAVTYNANGGSGAPSAQTKYYGKTLTLSTTKPTKAGHTFQGWATSASGSVAYAAGASYTANAAVTLYAVWKANTYTVSYNANGGSGAPTAQTKTYGTTLKLSSTKPTRTNYSFLGWATSSSATAATYAAGANYTANANATLYAVWELAYKKPTISELSASRCNSSGTIGDSGTYALIKFKWSCKNTVTSIVIAWTDAAGGNSGSATVSASGTSGAVSKVVGGGAFNVEKSYSFTVTVADGSSASNATDRSVTMSGMEFHVDFGEHATAIGKPAEPLVDSNGNIEKTFDVAWRSVFRNHICLGDKRWYHDGNQGIFFSNEGFMHLQRTTAQGYHPYIGFYLDDATAADGLIRLNSATKLMEFLDAAGYHFGSDIYLDNNEAIMGYDTSGAAYNAFQAKNESNNTIVGYGNYANSSGNTNVYGHDVNFGVSNIASPATFRPYRRQGDALAISIRTTGYVTNGGADVAFMVPFSVPIVGSPTVTVASLDGFSLRQGAKYTHGSSATAYCKPTSYTSYRYMFNGVGIVAHFDNTTNVTNNDAIGIYWNGSITFS